MPSTRAREECDRLRFPRGGLGDGRVFTDQRVERIALSGNTGYSTLPHLHFGVYSALDSRHLTSHPVTFTTARGLLTDPVEGTTYTAR